MADCPNHGTPLEVWPPPPKNGEPPLPLQPKTLTGRGWLDSLLGYGLGWLWQWGLGKGAEIVEVVGNAQIRAALRGNGHSGIAALPFFMPWVGMVLLMLALAAAGYSILRISFPKVARGFGTMVSLTVVGAGVYFVIASLYP